MRCKITTMYFHQEKRNQKLLTWTFRYWVNWDISLLANFVSIKVSFWMKNYQRKHFKLAFIHIYDPISNTRIIKNIIITLLLNKSLLASASSLSHTSWCRPRKTVKKILLNKKCQWESMPSLPILEAVFTAGYWATLADKKGKVCIWSSPAHIPDLSFSYFLTCLLRQKPESWVGRALLRSESRVRNCDLALRHVRCTIFEIHSSLRL